MSSFIPFSLHHELRNKIVGSKQLRYLFRGWCVLLSVMLVCYSATQRHSARGTLPISHFCYRIMYGFHEFDGRYRNMCRLKQSLSYESAYASASVPNIEEFHGRAPTQ
jgi:hypothetical protein